MSSFVLVGNGEFQAGMTTVDRAILERGVYRPCRVAILPTAAAPYRPEIAMSHAIRHFATLGAEPRPVMVLTRSDAENHFLAEPLSGVDVIYLAGGDPWYLLNTLASTPVWDMIMEQYALGRMVVGSGAGAMVLGDIMPHHDQPEWKPALGLASGMGIITNLAERRHDEVEALWGALPQGYTMLSIDPETGMVVDRERKTADVVGAGRVMLFGDAESHEYTAPAVIQW